MRRSINILNNTDWVTIGIYLVLVFLGWINIYAAVFDEQHESILDLSQRYGKQLIWIIAAIALAITIFLIDTKFYSVFAYIIYAIAILLLIGVLVIGKEIHGARSWFQIGGFQFQPSEFAKIAASLALAKYLSSYNIKIDSFRATVHVLGIILLPALLIAIQPDMGSALVFSTFLLVAYREGFSDVILILGVIMAFLFFLALLLDKFIIFLIIMGLALLLYWILSKNLKNTFVAGTLIVVPAGILYLLSRLDLISINRYYILLLAVAVALPVYLVYAYRKRLQNIYLILLLAVSSSVFTFSVDYVFHNVLKEHQQHRVNILLGIESDPLGLGYNVNQSKIAIGSGGFAGKGFLQGTQTKFDFVPEQSTDFIFCTVGEEWGFVGTSVVIGLFIFLLIRLIKIAERQRSDFSRIYGYGVVSVLFFHFTVNIGMTIGLLPVIGIPLPFFSYGGSSLWSFTILLFIMIRLDATRMELLK
jgi:rod shape determining protein RodA